MMKRAIVGVLAVVISTAQAVAVAEVSTSLTYDAITASDFETTYDMYVPAECSSREGPGQWWNHTEFYYGKSWAYSEIGGQVKAYSYALGPFGGDSNMHTVTGSANANQTSEYLIKSDTLPTGTVVSLLIDLSFSGYLFSDADATSITSFASASFSYNGSTLYEAAGSSSLDNLTDTGEWFGDFQQVITVGYYKIDTVDRISFDASVGDIIKLDLSLSTGIDVEAMGFQLSSVFDDGGSYAFVGAEDPSTGSPLDVTFEMVPEPATFLLLSLGGLILRRKK
jgi:hypothetical protein